MSKSKKIKLIALVILIAIALFMRLYLIPKSYSSNGVGNSTDSSDTEPIATLTLLSPTPELDAEYIDASLLDEDGTYSDVEDVANYIHTYGHLPDNYLTKSEAEDAGWNASKGNLWDVAYGMSIGGDRFGNYEGNLPKGETYYECDVNYDGGYRSDDRIVYSDSGDVWYTTDHYESFEKMY